MWASQRNGTSSIYLSKTQAVAQRMLFTKHAKLTSVLGIKWNEKILRTEEAHWGCKDIKVIPENDLLFTF